MIITGYSSFLSTLPIGSSSASYAYNMARKSLLQKNLQSLDTALSKGSLSDASRSYKTLVTNNPQYRSSLPASDLESPINAGFRNLAKALDDGKLDDAKAAWKTLTTEFDRMGLAITSGNETAAMARASLASFGQESVMIGWQTYNSKGTTNFFDTDFSAGSFLNTFA